MTGGRAPADVAELVTRASALAGRSLDELAVEHGVAISGAAARTKGKVGALLEAALGASGGSSRVHDFPELGVELKTIPLDARGRVRESTYVCTLPLEGIDDARWETSWVRAKLARVLWVPIDTAARRVLAPVLWEPTREQEAVLHADFDDIVGTIAIGGIESVTARVGRWLQARPKAADGERRAVAWGREGEAIPTVPRGFYLRARFTAAVLADTAAVPG